MAEKSQNQIAEMFVSIRADGAEQTAKQIDGVKQSVEGSAKPLDQAEAKSRSLFDTLKQGPAKAVGAFTGLIGRASALVGSFTAAFFAGQKLGEMLRGVSRDAQQADADLAKLSASESIGKLNEELTRESNAVQSSFLDRLLTGDTRSTDRIQKRIDDLRAQLNVAAQKATQDRAKAEAEQTNVVLQESKKRADAAYLETLSPYQRLETELQTQLARIGELRKKYTSDAAKAAFDEEERWLVRLSEVKKSQLDADIEERRKREDEERRRRREEDLKYQQELIDMQVSAERARANVIRESLDQQRAALESMLGSFAGSMDDMVRILTQIKNSMGNG